MKPTLFPLPPNRVWRTYTGGQMLDRIEGKTDPSDTHFPEDWIGSTTRAINTGREHLEEGIATIRIGSESIPLNLWVDQNPEAALGPDHLARYGKKAMVLTKFLDASVRLHLQCHPTIEFSKKHLNAESGKTEVYHILAIRPDQPNPYLYLGFQHPPDTTTLRRMIVNQEVEALEACFEKIPVSVGDTFFVPGGLPHAIGEGVLMVEIMEPTDFVVRFEFNRGGYLLPEAARFMGRDVDFGLSMLNASPISKEEVLTRYRVASAATALAPNSTEVLIGPAQTHCFGVKKHRIHGTYHIESPTFQIDLITSGSGTIRAEGESFPVKTYDRFFVPHALRSYEVEAPEGLEILSITPPSSSR